MQIANVLAVYRTLPLLFVMEADISCLPLRRRDARGCVLPGAHATTGHRRETKRVRLQDLNAPRHPAPLTQKPLPLSWDLTFSFP
jgi:hypothetical protein